MKNWYTILAASTAAAAGLKWFKSENFLPDNDTNLKVCL